MNKITCALAHNSGEEIALVRARPAKYSNLSEILFNRESKINQKIYCKNLGYGYVVPHLHHDGTRSVYIIRSDGFCANKNLRKKLPFLFCQSSRDAGKIGRSQKLTPCGCNNPLQEAMGKTQLLQLSWPFAAEYSRKKS